MPNITIAANIVNCVKWCVVAYGRRTVSTENYRALMKASNNTANVARSEPFISWVELSAVPLASV